MASGPHQRHDAIASPKIPSSSLPFSPLLPNDKISPVAQITVWEAYFLLIGFTALLK